MPTILFKSPRRLFSSLQLAASAVLAMALLVTLGISSGQAVAGPLIGEVSNSCAPWDGRALLVRLGLNGPSDITMDIWEKGIARLEAGNSVRLKEFGSHNTEGRFRYCEAEKSLVRGRELPSCVQANVTIEKVKYQANKQLSGEFTFQNKVYQFVAPFKVKPAGQQMSICG